MRTVCSLAAALSLGVASFAVAADPAIESSKIPLDTIWGLDMPGTRDVRSLDAPDDPIVGKARKQISESRKFDHGFAVRGERSDALREFLRVRADHPYWNRLPVDQPVSLVLFTKPLREAVVLHSIDRRETRIIPRFRFAPRAAAEAAPNLAIISLGKLPLGDYYVTPERLPAEQSHLDAGFEDPSPQRASEVYRTLGCSFHVVEGPGGTPPSEEPVEIPLKEIWAYNMPGTRDINEFGSSNAKESLVQRTLLGIRNTWRSQEGMAVSGEGREALENIVRLREALEDSNRHPGKLKWNVLSTNGPVSLAFYTKGTHPYIHLEKVIKQGHAFTIKYRPIPQQTAMSRSTLALIPVGELPSGKYRVIVEQLPIAQEYVDRGFPQPQPELINSISDSFGFVVVNRR